jgi:hypothetical protein
MAGRLEEDPDDEDSADGGDEECVEQRWLGRTCRTSQTKSPPGVCSTAAHDGAREAPDEHVGHEMSMTCLRAVKATPADIVKVTNYVTDRAYLATLVEARSRIMGELRTSSTAVVAALARDTLLVEVDAVVYVGGNG